MGLDELLGTCLFILAVPFFLGGSLGLLRFPDIYTRLHALTKADNVGLGLVVAGSVLLTDNWTIIFKLFIVWLAVQIASTISCHLVAGAADKRKVEPWKSST